MTKQFTRSVLVVAIVVVLVLIADQASAQGVMAATPWEPYGGLEQCHADWIGRIGEMFRRWIWGT